MIYQIYFIIFLEKIKIIAIIMNAEYNFHYFCGKETLSTNNFTKNKKNHDTQINCVSIMELRIK